MNAEKPLNADSKMADFEEFEPLFDYKRVQPRRIVSLDDDDEIDTTPALSPKKRKVYQKDGNVKAVYILDDEEEGKSDDEENENEDWLLPPPPKLTCDPKTLEESSTIRELRLKKQELLSFAQAAEDALKSMEESSKEEIGKSLESSLEAAKEEKNSTPEAERAKIVVSFQAKDCLKQFRVFSDDKFERIFKMYAEKSKLDLRSLVFCFDGDKVGPEATPECLGMEDNEIIEVHVRSS